MNVPTHAPTAPDLLQTLRLAQPALSRFDPLPRIISLDDFNRGSCGFVQLIGNYEGSLDSMLPEYAGFRAPMISTLSHWDTGSQGAMGGDYALKLATRAEAGAQSVAIKRLTFRKRAPIRLEFYFTFKPEASEMRLSEADVRSFGFLLDLQTGDTDSDGARVMPHLRFLNASNGQHAQRWQFKRRSKAVHKLGTEDKVVSHFHLSEDDWEDLAGGGQRLCYNEIPTKVNWHYVCFDFDLQTMQATGLRCNDRVFDLGASHDCIRLPAMPNLWCMLNLAFFIEADSAKRAFLYLDGVCLSGAL